MYVDDGDENKGFMSKFSNLSTPVKMGFGALAVIAIGGAAGGAASAGASSSSSASNGGANLNHTGQFNNLNHFVIPCVINFLFLN